MAVFSSDIPNVYFLQCPFGDCWTGITLIKGEANCLIDSGGNRDCVDSHLIPALSEIGMKIEDIDYLLCTHTHADHIGGHARIKELSPNIKIVSSVESADKLRSPLKYNKAIRAVFPEHSPAPSAGLCGIEPDIIVDDGDILLGELKYIKCSGHDTDSGCWLHLPSKTLISGDSLQQNGTSVQGIALYMDLPSYIETLDRLREEDIEHVLAGHDYLPLGYKATGRHEVSAHLDKCRDVVTTYDEFIKRNYDPSTDVPSLALALIEEVGGIVPKFLFLPLYTVTEHIKLIKK